MSDTSVCFHCGLVLAKQQTITNHIGGKNKDFCCHGCSFVCETIINSGNEEYYHLRDTTNSPQSRGTTDSDAWKNLVNDSLLYDRDDVQSSFVNYGKGKHKEAFLLLEDIRCSACVWLNERHLRAIPGIIDVEADYALQRLRVRWIDSEISMSRIIQAIASIGYIAHPYNAQHSSDLAELQKQRSVERIIFAGILGMVVMHFSLASYLIGGLNDEGVLPMWQIIGRWTGMLLVTAILAWPGQEFFISAWRDLRNKQLGMDIPVVLGLVLAWVGSLQSAINQNGDIYLDSIAMFVFLLLLSRYLELKGRLKAAANLDRLNKIIPQTARKYNAANLLENVAVIDLKVADKLQIAPGERLPVDAILLEGKSQLDESLITGEYQPQLKKQGDFLLGGSINGDQSIDVEVKQLLANSCMTLIENSAKQGALSKPKIAHLSDFVARYFIRTVLVFAFLTVLYHLYYHPTSALESVIAVLIVTCPCALALAIPLATSISAGKFIEEGIVPLRLQTMSVLADIDTIIFDKTGTLTVGKPTLLQTILLNNKYAQKDVLSITASLQRHSSHPFTHAFKDIEISPQHLALTDIVSQSGVGQYANFGHATWVVGSAKRLLDKIENEALVEHIQNQIFQYEQQLINVVLLLKDNQPVCLFTLQDAPREDVRLTLQKLQNTGLNCHVFSGDHQQSLDRLVKSIDVGFTSVRGALSPQDKLQLLKELQNKGHKVLMVGDGINDSLVLAQANASISFHDAPDLAKVHSDYLISGQNFMTIYKAIKLAKRSQTIIKQNLIWAAAYNLLALPFAMAGFIPAWGAAIGMSMSSLLVVINSKRI